MRHMDETISTTPLDLDAVRKRWEATGDSTWEAYFTVHGDPHVVVSVAPDDYGRANCEFIARSHADVPALCDEVEALRAELDRLRAVADAAGAWRHAQGAMGPYSAATDQLIDALDALDAAE